MVEPEGATAAHVAPRVVALEAEALPPDASLRAQELTTPTPTAVLRWTPLLEGPHRLEVRLLDAFRVVEAARRDLPAERGNARRSICGLRLARAGRQRASQSFRGTHFISESISQSEALCSSSTGSAGAPQRRNAPANEMYGLQLL